MKIKYQSILIREALLKDANKLTHWWNDGKVMSHAGFPNGLNTTIEKVIAQIKNNGINKHYLYIIEIDNVLVGEMNYKDCGNNIAEIGIKICEVEYQNKGYGTIIMKLFINELFIKLNFSKIILDTSIENSRANYFYQNKLGFKITNVVKNGWCNCSTKETCDLVEYELEFDDFMKFK